AFNLAVNLILIPPYGAMGATVGTASTIVGYNLLKQWALNRGSGITVFERRYATVYAAVSAGGLAVWLVELLGAAVPIRVVVTGAAIAGTLLVGRRLLMVGELFPELRKVPVFGRF